MMDAHTINTEEAEYLSTCNICFLNFDLDLCRPKALPCSHTFCFKCLQNMHFGTSLTCPVCCANIPLDRVASLPNNIYALHIIYLNQHIHQAYIPKKLSMHWCFMCESVAKSGCEKSHFILDMSIEAKELQTKFKRSKTNLVEAIGKRRQFKDNLELDDTIVSLLHFKTYSEEIRKQRANNIRELHRLEFLLEMSDFYFSGNRQNIETRFQETEIALIIAMELTEKWRVLIESCTYVPAVPAAVLESTSSQSCNTMQSKISLLSPKDVSSNVMISNLISSKKLGSNDFPYLSHSGLNGPYFPLNCRSIRIGSLEFKPPNYVLFSSGGITFDAPVINPQGQSSFIWINVTIPSKQILRVAASFNRSLPAIFLDVLPDLCLQISSQLDLHKNGPYWDCNSEDESQKRLVLLPFSLDSSAKNALEEAYLYANLFFEISKAKAKRLLIPPPTAEDNLILSKTKIASFSKSISSNGKIEKRITRSVTKFANNGQKKTQVLETISCTQNEKS